MQRSCSIAESTFAAHKTGFEFERQGELPAFVQLALSMVLLYISMRGVVALRTAHVVRNHVTEPFLPLIQSYLGVSELINASEGFLKE